MILRIFSRLRGKKSKKIEKADIDVGENGLRDTSSVIQKSFSWKEITKVELIWTENPWGDPQWGRYNDTEWIVWNKDGSGISFIDSSENREILLPALKKYLSTFSFDYEKFDKEHSSRVFSKNEGACVEWEKPV